MKDNNHVVNPPGRQAYLSQTSIQKIREAIIINAAQKFDLVVDRNLLMEYTKPYLNADLAIETFSESFWKHLESQVGLKTYSLQYL